MECNDSRIFNTSNPITYAVIERLFEFKYYYSKVHPMLSLLLCVLGLLANGVHILVLTRPRMRHSSVHTVLVCIAISDIGTMTSYLTYILRYEFYHNLEGYSYIWALFLKCHAMLSIALHAITLYLVVLMAFIRLSAMKISTSQWLDHSRALVSALTIAILVFIFCVPTLLAHQILETQREVDLSGFYFLYSVGFSDMMKKNHCFLMKGNLWLTGIFLKVIPCALLFIFTIALIGKLRENNEKRKILIKEERARRRGDLTTYMLLLMVTVFLCTELPQGILAILNAIYTTQISQYVYSNLADVLDVFSLINCFVAFLVYCFTSSKYRQTLFGLLPLTKIPYSGVSTRQGTLKLTSTQDRKGVIQRYNSLEVTNHAEIPLVLSERPNSAQPLTDF
ncbi:unnamed protein product [Caenorhabditis angaria]|uniref:G-protein coupled receptors family 1 profile domain-containing protein n=1 Tax=Caenorhabditis angaria TaxID=860376 RepID=A0A9P1IBF3_9PELO|nr:unnamed protein product [Caenorhabditis angaria]